MKLSNYKSSTIFTVIALVVLLAVNLVFVLTVQFFFKKEAIVVAKEKANMILDNNLSVHDYFSNDIKPVLFGSLADTLVEGNYFEPTWMSSTYVIIHLKKYFSQRNNFGYYYKDAAKNARSPENEADSIELKYLTEVNANNNTNPKDGIITIGDTDFYYVLKKGETMESQCMYCHNTPEEAPGDLVKIYGDKKSFNREEGEIISVVSIRIPINQAYQRASANIVLISLLTSGFVLLILVLYIYIQKKLIFAPIEVLQKRSIAIAHDNTLLGEKIAIEGTKDLSDFVNSFNIMSEQLGEYNKSLEGKIKAKTADLEKKVTEISQLNSTKDKLFSIIAHDLRNPFNTLLGFSKILLKNIHTYDRAKIEQQITYINQTAQKTYNLLNDMLLWAKAQSGKISFQPKALQLDEIAQELVLETNSLSKKKEITLNYSPSNEAVLFADEQMLKIVMRNLVLNAIKFSYPHNSINIHSEVSGKWVTIMITDFGVGIKKEDINKIWDISQNYTTTGTDQEKGTGFGLSLCKEFVEKHDGKIWVESEYEKGSVFKFTIPRNNTISDIA